MVFINLFYQNAWKMDIFIFSNAFFFTWHEEKLPYFFSFFYIYLLWITFCFFILNSYLWITVYLIHHFFLKLRTVFINWNLVSVYISVKIIIWVFFHKRWKGVKIFFNTFWPPPRFFFSFGLCLSKYN